MEDKNIPNRGATTPIGGSRAKTNINLRGNNTGEITLSIRCEDPKRLQLWAHWMNSQVRTIQLANELQPEPVAVNVDDHFESLAQAA